MKTLPGFSVRPYGRLADGSEVSIATLSNSNGIEVDVISYGGIITRLIVPDRHGQFDDIVLGLDSLEDYVAPNPHFGALIGRYANRIAGGQFSILGETIQLDRNNGSNHLHGGLEGFDKRNWAMKPFSTANSAGLMLKLTSPDGDQGYPGQLDVTAVYELNDRNELDVLIKATTTKATIVNMTQHSYFNLAGSGDVLGHWLSINADRMTPVDEHLIPTGEVRPVADSVFDFRASKPIGQDIDASKQQLRLGHGYDHNFILNEDASDELRLAASVSEPGCGRVMELWTVEPAMQFYTANHLDGSLAGKGRVYGPRSGFCLEPQHTPDSPNQPAFPTTTLLPGNEYQSRIVYRFSVTGQ